MAERVKELEVERLRKDGNRVWSISRLDSFDNCKLGYKLAYMTKDIIGKDNMYNLVGSFMHDTKEVYLKGEITKEKWLDNFDDYLFDLQMKGFKFINDKIKANYIECISHYIMNQQDNNNQHIIEKFILYHINGKDYIQGYVDYIDVNEGKFRIIDFKTSSEYTGEKKKKAGRQLVLYKIMLEKITGRKVDFIGWDMMKYCNICYKQKNGKIKKTFIARNKIASKMRAKYLKDLIDLGKLEFEANMILDDKEDIPKDLSSKYWIEDGLVEYEFNAETESEVLEYVKNIIKEIDNEKEYSPIDINDDNNFFCANLCGYKQYCFKWNEYRAK